MACQRPSSLNLSDRANLGCGSKRIRGGESKTKSWVQSNSTRFRLQADASAIRELRRGIFLLPSLFTGANLLCGYYAVVASLAGGWEDFDHAAKAIGLAILFDSLDGRVARMTGTNTEFGVQFDSLADVVSFGIAPAVMAYAWGVRSLPDQGSQRVRADQPIGLGFLPRVSNLLRVAAGAIQRARHGARRFKEFCGHAYTRGGGSDCLARAWIQVSVA